MGATIARRVDLSVGASLVRLPGMTHHLNLQTHGLLLWLYTGQAEAFFDDADGAIQSVDSALAEGCRCYAMYDNDEDERLVAISRGCPLHDRRFTAP
jgi:hypothetical protein